LFQCPASSLSAWGEGKIKEEVEFALCEFGKVEPKLLELEFEMELKGTKVTDDNKKLVEHLQAENARKDELIQKLQKQLVDTVETGGEFVKFVVEKVYPALESQTAMNIAALEALHAKAEEHYNLVGQGGEQV
jgi:hypothetical protein